MVQGLWSCIEIPKVRRLSTEGVASFFDRIKPSTRERQSNEAPEEKRGSVMIACRCGNSLTLPAILVGLDRNKSLVLEMQCRGCGKKTKLLYTNLREVKLDRAEKLPPPRGSYHKGADTLMCCPLCKCLSPIKQPVHAIDQEGVVAPSVVCPNGCGFHAFVTLDKWEEEKSA